jgi:hypothetical protein
MPFYRMGQHGKAIRRNKAILVAPREAYAGWLPAGYAAGLMNRMAIRFDARHRALQHAPSHR